MQMKNLMKPGKLFGNKQKKRSIRSNIMYKPRFA